MRREGKGDPANNHPVWKSPLKTTSQMKQKNYCSLGKNYQVGTQVRERELERERKKEGESKWVCACVWEEVLVTNAEGLMRSSNSTYAHRSIIST